MKLVDEGENGFEYKASGLVVGRSSGKGGVATGRGETPYKAEKALRARARVKFLRELKNREALSVRNLEIEKINEVGERVS